MKAFIFRPYTRNELSEDAKWIFLLVAACIIEAGLFKAIASPFAGLPFVCTGLVFITVALMPSFWFKFAFMLLWGFGLVADMAVRMNPFAVIFAVIAFYYVYKMIRYCRVKEGALPAPPDAPHL